MGMTGNGNVKSHSRTSLLPSLTFIRWRHTLKCCDLTEPGCTAVHLSDVCDMREEQVCYCGLQIVFHGLLIS